MKSSTPRHPHPTPTEIAALDSAPDLSLLSVGADPPAPPHPLNPDYLASFRVTHAPSSESIKVGGVVRVAKPGKTTWFQSLPDDGKWEAYYIYESESGDLFLVAPHVAESPGVVATRKLLVPCITLDGEVLFWPLSVPDHPNSWSESARMAADQARTEWTRIAANMSAKQYDIYKPLRPRPAPAWPSSEELRLLLTKGFAGRTIVSLDHPEMRKLLLE